jgi:CheY-like chemotaxis protein
MATLNSPDEATNIDPAVATSDLVQALGGPLDGLLAMGELLSCQPLAENAREQVHAMLAAARRMARLLDDANGLIDASASYAPEPACLREIVDAVEIDWRERRRATGCSLLLSCAFQPDVRVMVDPPRLKKFLNILIEDALDYAARGVVDVQLSTAFDGEGGVVVEGLVDSLNGPHAADVSRLAVYQAAARALNGEVSRNSNPGSGEHVRFVLRLPLAAGTTDEGASEEEESPLPPRTHLLIVDDNATNRMVAAALCNMFGCTSETAEDGVEAVEALRVRAFDLVLMDIKMPRMDGLEATRAIRALGGQAAQTPIVALTANADPDAVAVYLAGGMVAVVDKPIKPAQLLSALQGALAGASAKTLARQAPAA